VLAVSVQGSQHVYVVSFGGFGPWYDSICISLYILLGGLKQYDSLPGSVIHMPITLLEGG
jgi:hypothetical protein